MINNVEKLPKFKGLNLNEAIEKYKGATEVEDYNEYKDYLKEVIKHIVSAYIKDLEIKQVDNYFEDEIELYLEADKESIDFRLLINPYKPYSIKSQKALLNTLIKYKEIGKDLIESFYVDTVSSGYINLLQRGMLYNLNMLYGFNYDCTLGELSFLLGYQLLYLKLVDYNPVTNELKAYIPRRNKKDICVCTDADDISDFIGTLVDSLEIKPKRKAKIKQLVKSDFDVSKYVVNRDISYYHVILDKLCKDRNIFIPQDTLLTFSKKEIKRLIDAVEADSHGICRYEEERDKLIQELRIKIDIINKLNM